MTVKRIIILVFFLISFILLLKVLFLAAYPDFRTFYFNPKMVMSGGNPYFGGKDLYTPSVYPPFLFLFFIPITYLPYILAEKIWILVSIIFLILSILLIFKSYKVKLSSNLVFLIFGLSFLFFPAKFTLGMGQINLLILLLISLGFYFSVRKNDFLTGLFFGLSFLLKLFPILIVIYLFAEKRYKALIYFGIICTAGILVSFLLIRPEINNYFYSTSIPGLISSWKGDYYNQALSGLIMREVQNADIRMPLKIFFSLILFAFSVFTIFKQKSNDKYLAGLKFGMILTLNVLINIFSWQHHFIWILPSLILTLLFIIKCNRQTKFFILITISYLLMAINLKDPSSYPTLVRSHVFFGALLLYFLQLYLIKKAS